MAAVMLLGTLNRVMIVELSVPATIVAIMIAIPVLVAPFRALLGFRSDNYRSAIGWKRIPYLWFGSLWQFGGPDRATEETRPQVVALLYVMFLIGMGVSAIVVGALLQNFSGLRLVQVVQGTAVVTLVLNIVALWKQEKVNPMTKEERAAPKPQFRDAWNDLTSGGHAGRLLVAVFLGTMAFNMQDVLLEPYGGEVLGLSVSATTLLTAMWAGGALLGFGFAAARQHSAVLCRCVRHRFGRRAFRCGHADGGDDTQHQRCRGRFERHAGRCAQLECDRIFGRLPRRDRVAVRHPRGTWAFGQSPRHDHSAGGAGWLGRLPYMTCTIR